MKSKQRIVIGIAILAAVAVLVVMMRVIVSRNQEPVPEAPEHTPSMDITRMETDNTDPAGAVAGLLGALRGWDMGLAAQWMGALPESIFTEAYHGLLSPLLARIEYDVGAQKITGDTALVDVSVTAVDLNAAFGDLTADAAGYLLTCTVEQVNPAWEDFLTGYLEQMDVESMLRVKRNATVHLVRDSGGKWRVDTGNPENQAFLNAVTGGFFDLVQALDEVRTIL